jgi:hypothetical protein
MPVPSLSLAYCRYIFNCLRSWEGFPGFFWI